jgi:hypothetical protein
MLCGIAWRVDANVAGGRFDELRELCTAAGDKASLAIALAGLVMDHVYQDRMPEASQRASEAMAVIESIGEPTLTVGLSFAPTWAKTESAAWGDVLRWSQRVIGQTRHSAQGAPIGPARPARTCSPYPAVPHAPQPSHAGEVGRSNAARGLPRRASTIGSNGLSTKPGAGWNRTVKRRSRPGSSETTCATCCFFSRARRAPVPSAPG